MLFLAFRLGAGLERWLSGRMDDMQQAHDAGYEKGYMDSTYDHQKGGIF